MNWCSSVDEHKWNKGCAHQVLYMVSVSLGTFDYHGQTEQLQQKQKWTCCFYFPMHTSHSYTALCEGVTLAKKGFQGNYAKWLNAAEHEEGAVTFQCFLSSFILTLNLQLWTKDHAHLVSHRHLHSATGVMVLRICPWKWVSQGISRQ